MEAMMDCHSNIRSHWLYQTLEVVGVLIVGTLITVGIVGVFAKLFCWIFS